MNKNKMMVLFVGLMVMFGFGLSSASAATKDEVINLKTPAKEKDAEAAIKALRVQPKEILFMQGESSGGYIVQKGESVSQALNNLKEENAKFLEKDTARKGMTAKAAPKNDFVITGVKVEGKKISEKEAKLAPMSSVYYVAERLWAPTEGEVEVDDNSAWNGFKFNEDSGFDSFKGIMTYEHETQIYDSKYAGSVRYWRSNLPSAYFDTGIFDSIDNFTIGSSKASDIKERSSYYTYLLFNKGTVRSASVRIKGQLGHRSPSSCYSTWCVWADMTTGTLASFTAPITYDKSWTYRP